MSGQTSSSPSRRMTLMTALSLVTLLATSPETQASQVAKKLIGNPTPPSPESLANSTPIKLPQLSVAQLKKIGILGTDGKLNRPLSAPPDRKGSLLTVLPKASSGGPVLDPVQVIPNPKRSTRRDTPSDSNLRLSTLDGTPAPLAYGSSLYEFPFTTSRIETGSKAVNSKAYPFRTTGKLFITLADGSSGHCSATLIAKGILITAAHCVASYGGGYFAANWTFYPGLYNGKSSYGSAQARAVYAPVSYVTGAGSCIDGVNCIDDVAIIVLADKKGKFIGSRTGWMSVGVDDYGYNSFGEMQITQLGYPSGIDGGNQIIRNDSRSEQSGVEYAYNTFIGSSLNQGSSGGPWVNNFGTLADTSGVFPGFEAEPNVIVGVTSWGIPGSTAAIAASSPFLSEILGPLAVAACTDFPAACAP